MAFPEYKMHVMISWKWHKNFSTVVSLLTTALSWQRQIAICTLLVKLCYPFTTMDHIHLATCYDVTSHLSSDYSSTSILLSHFQELYKIWNLSKFAQISYFVKYNQCYKRPLSKRPKIGFQDQLSLNVGQKYCRMLREHSSILLTVILLPFVI